MAAGREADGTNLIGVDAVGFGIRAQETHGGFAVINLGWEGGFAAEPIGDGRSDVATRSQCLCDLGMAGAVTLGPAATMDAYDRG